MSTETNDTIATVRYDGQEFSIDKTVAESDSLLRAALAGVYPSLATAAFSRTTEDGRLIVSATKTAGTKGGDAPLERLRAARERVNPAVRVATKVSALIATGQLTPQRFVRLGPTMSRAAKRGSLEAEAIRETAKRLKDAEPEPSVSRVGLL